MDARRPQRIDRHRRAERRIDAARQAQHDAGKAILLDIFAQAQHAGRIIGFVALLDRGQRRLDADPASCLALPHGLGDDSRKRRQLRGERAIGIEGEGGAVEDEFVLAADLLR